MKKQLLIAAVAATMTSAAMADISISGDAKFEYQNVEATGVAINVNQTNTEVNLKLRGKSGDTTVVMDIAANGGAAAAAAGQGGTVVEDMYLTTKVGDVTVKAGNYATGTSSILGEIDNGSRSNNKVTLTTTLGGATVYVGNAGSSAASTGFTTINNNMFAGVKMDVAGVTVQAKKVSDTVDAFGVSGDMSGVGFRLEQKQGTGSNTDVVFGNVTTDVNGISLGYAWIDADADTLIGEDDSSIFAVENNSLGDSNSQFTASTSVQGNKVTLKAGTVGFKAATLDRDYTQVAVSRSLASGATASVTYTDKELTDTTDSQTFEAELSVKF